MSRLYGVALTQVPSPPRPRSRAPPARQQLLRCLTSRATKLCACLTIALFASREVVADALTIGHHHGLVLLAAVKASRALAELQRDSEEALEGVQALAIAGEKGAASASSGLLPARAAFALCACACGAGLLEICRDLRPRGHHGTVLLAIAEMHKNAAGALRHYRPSPRNGGGGGRARRAAAAALARCRGALESSRVRSCVFLAAAACAGAEIVEDATPGAHHGVAILATAELVENVARAVDVADAHPL